MKNKKLLAIFLTAILLLSVSLCTVAVSAADTTDLLESTDTPSGDRDEDAPDDDSMMPDDSENGEGTDKETGGTVDSVIDDVSDKADSVGDDIKDEVDDMKDKDKEDGNISTNDDGTVGDKEDSGRAGVWAVVIAIVIIVAVIICLCILIPKRKDR